MTYAAPAIALPTPLVICNSSSPWSEWAWYRTAVSTAVPASTTGLAANQAQYYPFLVTTPATFTRGFWINGSVPSGNVDVGIYTPDGVRRASTGAVACTGASILQSAAFTASYAATPGLYYMAVSYSNAAAANAVWGNASVSLYKMGGIYVQASAHPLPANATFAAWTASIVPVMGIAQTSFAL